MKCQLACNDLMIQIGKRSYDIYQLEKDSEKLLDKDKLKLI
jgi:hypothetical protein